MGNSGQEGGDDHFNIAYLFYEKRDFRVAVQYFKEAIRLNPDSPRGYHGLGWVYFNTGNYPEAIKYFKEAIKISPDDAEGYNGLGWNELKIGNYPEAIKYFKEAIKISPDDNRGYNGLGWNELKIGNYPEAIKYFKEAIRLNPDSPRGYHGLGWVYFNTGNYPEAIKYFKEAIKISPDNPRGYDGLGWVYFNTGKYPEAIKSFKEVGKTTYYACSYEGLGNVYRRLGNPLLTENNFLKVIQSEPYKYKGYYELAGYYVETGKLDKAGDNIERAMGLAFRDKDRQKILELKGFVLILKQDYGAAEVIFNSLIKQSPANSFALAGLGHIYNARQDYQEARHYFNKSIGIGGRGKDIAMMGLGWVNANEGKHKEAILCYQKVLKDNPQNILALLGLGNAYGWLEEYGQAEKCFKCVLKIDPLNEYALAGLGTVYLNQGQIRKAEGLFGKSLQKNKTTYSCPYEGLGLLYLRQGRFKEAEDSFKKAISINPEIEYKKYNGLARIYIRQGKIPEARGLLEKSIKNYPYDTEARELLQGMGINIDKIKAMPSGKTRLVNYE